jgi:hypothetical protein
MLTNGKNDKMTIKESGHYQPSGDRQMPFFWIILTELVVKNVSVIPSRPAERGKRTLIILSVLFPAPTRRSVLYGTPYRFALGVCKSWRLLTKVFRVQLSPKFLCLSRVRTEVKYLLAVLYVSNTFRRGNSFVFEVRGYCFAYNCTISLTTAIFAS